MLTETLTVIVLGVCKLCVLFDHKLVVLN